MISVTRIPEEVSYVATYIFRVQRGRQSIKLNLFISSIRWLQFTDNKQVASIVYLCKRLQPRDAERSRLRGWLEGRFWRGVWLGRRDSNPDTQLQRLQSYR